MVDFRALCTELVEALDELNCHFNIPSQSAIIERVHAALAEPEPAPAADGDLLPAKPPNIPSTMAMQYRSAWREGVEDGWNEARASLARLSRPAVPPASLRQQALRPIPMSERLPEKAEMTDDDEAWVEYPGGEYPLGDTGDYDWEPHKWILSSIAKSTIRENRRWLPARALPLPEVE